MDYGKLIGRALDISWQYKLLWIFGFFAALFGGMSGRSQGFISADDRSQVATFITQHMTLLLILAAYGVFLLLFFLTMHLIGTAGLIGGVIQIERSGSCTIRECFRTGAKYFSRYLGLWILALITIAVIVFLLIFPVILAFVISAILGILSLLVVIPLALIAAFFFTNIYALSQREIVIGDKRVGEAITEAYTLIKTHLGKNLVIFIITFAVEIILVTLNMLLTILFSLPLIAGLHRPIGVILMIFFFGIPIFIAVAILLTGIFGVFLNSLFTLFYLELRRLSPPSPAVSSASLPPGNI
jgi:hypothetical protein